MTKLIRDILSPEFYDYYKKNQVKYQKFVSDPVMLQAQLFKDMVDEGVFPSKKHKHNWEYECDCTVWLSNVLNKICTFDEFRKLYRDRLKKYKFKSPEYYAECERIVAEHDVEYVRKNMRAKSMRNYVARNYPVPTPLTKENTQITKSAKQTIISSSIFEQPWIQPHNSKYEYNIEEEKSYAGYDIIPYIVTKHCRECVYDIGKRDIRNIIESSLHITWKDFLGIYNDYIAGMDALSLDFKYQCYAIVLEKQYEQKNHVGVKNNIIKAETNSNTLDSEDKFDNNLINFIYQHYRQLFNKNYANLKINFSLIFSFFVFGGIAYVFKHLLYLLWFVVSNIAISLFNIVVWIFCLLFNLEGPSEMIDFNNMLSPLKVWQIGGWCYGIIITSVLLWRFFMWLGKMSDRFLKK